MSIFLIYGATLEWHFRKLRKIYAYVCFEPSLKAIHGDLGVDSRNLLLHTIVKVSYMTIIAAEVTDTKLRAVCTFRHRDVSDDTGLVQRDRPECVLFGEHC